MIKTKRGLPNTCSICEKPCTEFWYAENTDAARAGGGLCADCEEIERKSAEEAEVTEEIVEEAEAKAKQPKRKASKRKSEGDK